MIKKLSFPKKSVSIVIRLERFCVRDKKYGTGEKPGFFRTADSFPGRKKSRVSLFAKRKVIKIQ
ncbi:MAG: hypothetical protein DRI57_24600 [Deltaproteobacteria bacterium]|nr:MAG: hypothetical protein DRI57_24600 [Deltaproteobacteria bacterium]